MGAIHMASGTWAGERTLLLRISDMVKEALNGFHFQRGDMHVGKKDGHELFSDADLIIEQKNISMIKNDYPADIIISE
jgi:fructose-1,6-bisphosphatase/inositol monophosphatase family enzyme